MNHYDNGHTIQAPPQAPKVSGPIEQIVATLRLARDVAERTQYLIGRICGHIPQPGEASLNGEKPSNGVLPDLAENAVDTRRQLLATIEELNRLESTIS